MSESLRRVDVSLAEELLESEQRFSLLVDAVRDYAIFMIDPAGHVVTWNVGARRIKGYESEEIIGKHISVFYPPEDVAAGKPQRLLKQALANGRLEDKGIRVRKDGTRFYADVILTPVFDATGVHKGFAKVTRDMTQQVLAEQQALEAKEAAEAANRAKSEFLAVMSHELRTPLNAIIGFSDLLLSLPAEQLSEEQVHEYVQHIHSGGLHLLNLVNDILDLTKIEAGRMDLAPTRFQVEDEVRNTFHMVAGLAAEKRVHLVTQVQEGLTLCADGARFNQIVLNLLSNAIKFTPQGGRVSVRVWSEADRVALQVADTGVGISHADQERLFRPFEQINPSSRTGGTGLGLAITRRLVEAHGGRIELASEPGAGSTFTCWFPQNC